MTNTFKQVSDERYEILTTRYKNFQAAMSSFDLHVVNVFDPLTQKQIDELELIREVSKDLQKKKEEDVNKAQEQAAEVQVKEEIIDAEVETALKEDA